MDATDTLSPRSQFVDRLARRSLFWGVGGSLVLHLVAFAVVVIGGLHGWIGERPLQVTAIPPHAVELGRSAAQVPAFTLVAAPSTSEISPSMLRSRLDEVVADAKQQSPTENLEKLDRLATQLNNITSDKSLDDMTGRFQQWMGLEQRVAEPSEAKTVDEFDSDSAQLDDVERTRKPDGSWKYVARLIDKRGRTISVEMGDIDGRAAYELMEKLKANPVLEKIYRRIAMPLIDSLVKPPK